MTDAASPFLNRPLRAETEARAACEQTERERRRRLEQHGADFCRQILDGAFERVYQTDGRYRLRDVATGAWFEEQWAASDPIVLAARRCGYRAALGDMARWISVAAVEPHMHADTLSALNAQIAALAGRVASAGADVPELG